MVDEVAFAELTEDVCGKTEPVWGKTVRGDISNVILEQEKGSCATVVILKIELLIPS